MMMMSQNWISDFAYFAVVAVESKNLKMLQTDSVNKKAEIVVVFNCREDQFSERRSTRVTELCIAEQS